MLCQTVRPPQIAPTGPLAAQVGASVGPAKQVSIYGRISNGRRRVHDISVAGGVIQLELSWIDPATDLDLVLYDPLGQDVDVSIHGKPERIEYDTRGMDGEYIVEVVHFCGPAVVYNLHARFAEKAHEEDDLW